MTPLVYTVGTAQTCSGSPCTAIPANVRPLSTPRVVLRADGDGFVIFTSWYRPVSCTKGEAYLTVHEVLNDGLSMRSAAKIADEPVTGVVAVGDGLVVVTSTGIQAVPGFAPTLGGGGAGGGSGGAGGAGGNNNFTVGSGLGEGQYRILTWTEMP